MSRHQAARVWAGRTVIDELAAGGIKVARLVPLICIKG
jgi:hypothetical protein